MAISQPNELTEFLAGRQDNMTDWPARRREWTDAVSRLHAKIQGELLREAHAQGLVSFSQEEKEITEDHLGTYRLPELLINFGSDTVRISPKGRNVVGAKGRVDLVGDLDSVPLVLDSDGTWRIVFTRSPLSLAPLDTHNFTEALRKVLR